MSKGYTKVEWLQWAKPHPILYTYGGKLPFNVITTQSIHVKGRYEIVVFQRGKQFGPYDDDGPKKEYYNKIMKAWLDQFNITEITDSFTLFSGTPQGSDKTWYLVVFT